MSLVEAEKAQKSGKYKKAVEFYRLAVKDEPDNPKVYEGLAKSLYCTKDFAGALDAARKAEDLHPFSVEIHVTRSAIYVAQKQFEEAKIELAKALEIAPNSSGALCNLGVISALENKYDEAISLYARAIEADPQNYYPHRNLAHLYAVKKDIKNSFRESWKAFQLRPTFGMALFILLELLVNPFILSGLSLLFLAVVLVLGIALNSGLLLALYFLPLFLIAAVSTVRYVKQKKPFWIFVAASISIVVGWFIYRILYNYFTK